MYIRQRSDYIIDSIIGCYSSLVHLLQVFFRLSTLSTLQKPESPNNNILSFGSPY